MTTLSDSVLDEARSRAATGRGPERMSPAELAVRFQVDCDAVGAVADYEMYRKWYEAWAVAARKPGRPKR